MSLSRYFGQEENEEIIKFIRKHPIVILPKFIMILLIYVAAIVTITILPNYLTILSSEFAPNILAVSVSLVLLFATLYFFVEWTLYYLHVSIITSEKIVDAHQHSLFSNKIATMHVKDIQDVSAMQGGILQSFMRYGNVSVQTAGEKPNFLFEKVPSPYILQREIMELRDNFHRANSQDSKKAVNDGIHNIDHFSSSHEQQQ